MKKITKDFLLKHGINEGPTNWFLYKISNKMLTRCAAPIKHRIRKLKNKKLLKAYKNAK